MLFFIYIDFTCGCEHACRIRNNGNSKALTKRRSILFNGILKSLNLKTQQNIVKIMKNKLHFIIFFTNLNKNTIFLILPFHLV